LLLCGRFLVEKAEQVKTASIISAEGDTEAADLLASAFAKAGEGLVSILNIVVPYPVGSENF
jgi:prohibitin 1